MAGSGGVPELFYTNNNVIQVRLTVLAQATASCIVLMQPALTWVPAASVLVPQAYKNYISYILNRRNTVTGVLYKDDPIIFALELANEPRTTDNYEYKLGLKPGSTVLGWVYETAAYVKSISPNHMVRGLWHLVCGVDCASVLTHDWCVAFS